MTALPSSLALTTIQTSSQILSADHRNNYAAIQTQGNGFLTALSSGAVGQLLAALSSSSVGWAYPPGYQFARDQIAADTANITATTEGTSQTVIAGSSVTYDGSTEVKIEFWAPGVSVSASPTNITFVLYRDATVIGQFLYVASSTGAVNPPVTMVYHEVPSNAAHTYTVKAFVNANTLNVKAGAASGSGTLLKAFLKVSKV